MPVLCFALTKMSPFSSRPGSMVMQMLVLLSPCTLLWVKEANVLLKSNNWFISKCKHKQWSWRTIFLKYRLAASPGRSWGTDGSLWRETKEKLSYFNIKQSRFSLFLSILRSTLASFGLEVGYAVHHDMVQEQRLVVDLDVAGQEAVEVSHIPAETGKTRRSSNPWTLEMMFSTSTKAWSKVNTPSNRACFSSWKLSDWHIRCKIMIMENPLTGLPLKAAALKPKTSIAKVKMVIKSAPRHFVCDISAGTFSLWCSGAITGF